MNKQLLPIGSVVSLDGATKKIMIIGLSVKRENDENIYDYIGVPYPEGYIDSNTLFLFMNEDVKHAHFVGYVNAEAQLFFEKYSVLDRNDTDDISAE